MVRLPFSPRLAVYKIGVELEGGFKNKVSGERYHYDGSVRVENTSDCHLNFVGEVVSRPFDDLDMVLDWVDHYYPDKVNSSCGCHVHVSFTNRLAYMLTMSQDYYDYFLDRMGAWGKSVKLRKGSGYWSRLEGKNSFCKKMPKRAKTLVCEGQKGTDNNYACDRYYQLNHCWAKHKTLECRLLPCFKNKKFTMLGIKEFVNLTNDFLATQKNEPEFVTDIELVEPKENRIEVIAI